MASACFLICHEHACPQGASCQVPLASWAEAEHPSHLSFYVPATIFLLHHPPSLSRGSSIDTHDSLSAPPLIRPASVFLSLTSYLSMADFTPPLHSLWAHPLSSSILGTTPASLSPGWPPRSLLGPLQGNTFLLGLNSTALSLGFCDHNSLQSLGLTSWSTITRAAHGPPAQGTTLKFNTLWSLS